MFHKKRRGCNCWSKLGNTGEKKEALLTPGGHRGAFYHPSYRLWGGLVPLPLQHLLPPHCSSVCPPGLQPPQPPFKLSSGPDSAHSRPWSMLFPLPGTLFPVLLTCHTWTPCNPPGKPLPDGRTLFQPHGLSFAALRLELKCACMVLRFSSHPNTL